MNTTLSQLTDVQLIVLAKRGNRAAFSALFHRHNDAIYSVLLRRARNDHTLARDWSQEVWSRAFEKLSSFAPTKGAFRSWLFGIFRYVSFEEHRKKMRSPVPVEDLSLHQTTAFGTTAPSPHTQLAQDQVHTALRDCIDRLEDDIDRAIVAARGENVAYKTIAEMVQLGSDACRQRFRRAKEDLKTCLERKGITHV